MVDRAQSPTVAATPLPPGAHDAARRRGDPAADAVVEALYARGDLARTNRLLQVLAARPGVVPTALPDPLERFLVAEAVWPAWARPAAVRRGQEVFARYSMPALAALLYRSLPECYACARGVHVLARSQRIDTLVHRRVAETLQFVVDAMTPGGPRRRAGGAAERPAGAPPPRGAAATRGPGSAL